MIVAHRHGLAVRVLMPGVNTDKSHLSVINQWW